MGLSMDEPVYVGVLHVVLTIPGARTRKDRRQVIRSLRDRVRHRFEVTFHQLGDGDHPGRQAVVVTTAGNEPRVVRSVLDRVRSFVESQGTCWPGRVDVDVFRWHPGHGDWDGLYGEGAEEDPDG